MMLVQCIKEVLETKGTVVSLDAQYRPFIGYTLTDL